MTLNFNVGTRDYVYGRDKQFKRIVCGRISQD